MNDYSFEYYCNGDEDNDDTFTYEPSSKELREAMADIVFNNCTKSMSELTGMAVKKCFMDFLDDNDLELEMFRNYYEELKDYFEDDAIQYHKEYDE